MCGVVGACQWAYDHTDPFPLYRDPVARTHPYSPDPRRYVALCRGDGDWSCHAVYDRMAAAVPIDTVAA